MAVDISERAPAELIDRAQVIGQLHGVRRFRAYRKQLQKRALVQPRIAVPPEFFGHFAATSAYFKAEEAGYLGAVEDAERDARIAALFEQSISKTGGVMHLNKDPHEKSHLAECIAAVLLIGWVVLCRVHIVAALVAAVIVIVGLVGCSRLVDTNTFTGR